MKIYNEVVIDMNTGTTIYEDSFEYDGPVMLMCGGDPGPDYTAERDILNRQKASVNARKEEVGEYFAQLNQFAEADKLSALDEYGLGKQTRVDDFLTQSYSIGKQQDITKRKSDFESNTEQQYDIEMTDANRERTFDNVTEMSRISHEKEMLGFDKSQLERDKAYEDQMNQIEDMLYQIESSYAATY